MLSHQVDADVPGILEAQVWHVLESHGPVVAKLSFLAAEIDLGLLENLDVFGEVVVCVDVHATEGAVGVEGED